MALCFVYAALRDVGDMVGKGVMSARVVAQESSDFFSFFFLATLESERVMNCVPNDGSGVVANHVNKASGGLNPPPPPLLPPLPNICARVRFCLHALGERKEVEARGQHIKKQLSHHLFFCVTRKNIGSQTLASHFDSLAILFRAMEIEEGGGGLRLSPPDLGSRRCRNQNNDGCDFDRRLRRVRLIVSVCMLRGVLQLMSQWGQDKLSTPPQHPGLFRVVDSASVVVFGICSRTRLIL